MRLKRESLLWMAVVALLLLNTGTLAYLVLGPRGGRPGGPDNPAVLIRETLALSSGQEAQFARMRDAHHAHMVQLGARYDSLLQPYFGLLQRSSYTQQQRDSLEGLLAATQGMKAAVTFDHFAELKSICTVQQQQKFAVLMPRLTQIMLGGPAGKNRPR